MRVGLIGAGRFACAYAEALAGCNDAALAGVADICVEKAESLAREYGIKGFGSYEKMLGELSPDAVIICTPPVTHRDISIALSGRRIPHLCEKPFALDAAMAGEMLEAARSTSTVITGSSKFRAMEDVLKARGLIESGVIGTVLTFRNVFSYHISMAGRWNSDPKVSGGGVIIDNGTHSLDLLRYFAGPVTSVLATESGREQGLHVEENAVLMVETEKGVRGEISLSWNMDVREASFINIGGSLGEIAIGWKESMYRLRDNPQWISFGRGYDRREVLREQVCSFTGVIEGRRQPLATSRDILSTVMAVDAAYESLRTSRRTQV